MHLNLNPRQFLGVFFPPVTFLLTVGSLFTAPLRKQHMHGWKKGQLKNVTVKFPQVFPILGKKVILMQYHHFKLGFGYIS